MSIPADYTAECDLAVSAVRDAVRLCEAVRSTLGDGVMQKGDRSPVTIADFGSQALVCRRIAMLFPDDPVIGEESAVELRKPGNAALSDRVIALVADQVPGATRDQVLSWIDRGAYTEYASRYWTVDPIDGTKGFLRGDQYAVALALVVDGIPVVSAVACPSLKAPDGTTGVVMTAIQGQGTLQGPLFGEIVDAVRVSDTAIGSQARFCESVESGHSSHDDSASVASSLGITKDPVRMDSQAKYAVVARGEADLYLRLPTRPGYVEKIWDHAAGALLVEEAGGRVSDLDGKPLSFVHGARLSHNNGIIVTNGHLHEEVLSALISSGVAE